ncbi:formate dehydrogenase subunit gamma [Prosthecomicrobium sp. N25]|uniref:formate dehydrogenase subunit gamma n=1 Tax=Prosthecomicrobium sp. N25 TaxID=3129254 RepID=UPI0030789E58
MIPILHRLRAAAAGLLLAAGLATLAAAPAAAQSVNPTASAVKEEQLLQELQKAQGRVSIPDAKSGTLIQPQGREWRAFHEETLPKVAGAAILGGLALCVLFYLVRGKIRIDSGRSDRTITRFGGFERFVHWLTASSFLVLALSGLNVTFGKHLLLPIVGPQGFHIVSEMAKTAHNYLSFPFALGVVLMLLIWIKDNIPNGTDLGWFAKGGGILSKGHPPAGRFNGGQKVIFWTVVLGGGAIAASGYMLMFPFYVTDMAGMQLSQMVHGILAGVVTAVIIGHIYIGSVGMEGAFDAMGSGEVDLNWAREHHSLWVEEITRKDPTIVHPGGRMAPAE